MADTIREQFGIESEMIKGSGGIFDVQVDGQLIFSKHKVGRFPEHQEIVDLLKKRQ